jgi:Na+-transporting methylmalonyl-CoA/oxaloacetate decarboxylase gamma subunit
MGIVFSCLALLFVFFSLLGKYMARKEKSDRESREAGWVKTSKTKTARMPIEANDSKIPPSKKKKEDDDVYLAVIAMALKEYQDNLHDEESGIITIRPHHTMWNNDL